VLLPGYASSLNASGASDSMAVYESLDTVKESTAALWLPVALAASLLVTLSIITLTNGPSSSSFTGVEFPFTATIAKAFQSVAVLGNVAVCILFVKAVIKSTLEEFKFDKLLVSSSRIYNNNRCRYIFSNHINSFLCVFMYIGGRVSIGCGSDRSRIYFATGRSIMADS